MKKTLLLVLTASLVAGLAFCAKKKGAEEVSVPPPEPGEFGITRTIWDTTVTPQRRVELAATMKDVEIELQGNEKATIETNKGTIVVKLYSNDAPKAVGNFIRLAESGFYDGLIWHRYVPGFVIQGGDPIGDGTGDAGYSLYFGPGPGKHIIGALGLAHGGNPNTGSCQFYICLADKPHLDGNYVVFAKTVEGMDVVSELRRGDTIVKVTISRD